MEIIIMVGKDSESFLEAISLIIIEYKRRVLNVDAVLKQCLFALHRVNDVVITDKVQPIYDIINNTTI